MKPLLIILLLLSPLWAGVISPLFRVASLQSQKSRSRVNSRIRVITRIKSGFSSEEIFNLGATIESQSERVLTLSIENYSY